MSKLNDVAAQLSIAHIIDPTAAFDPCGDFEQGFLAGARWAINEAAAIAGDDPIIERLILDLKGAAPSVEPEGLIRRP